VVVQLGLRTGPVKREIPSASLRAGSSLRLKNGYAQDDSHRVIVKLHHCPDFHRLDKRLMLKVLGSDLPKPFIQPVFIFPSSLIALAPFRYLWNNPPSFVGKSFLLAFLTPIMAAVVTAFASSYLMTVCWRLWKSD
jgi:hypothetical protein